MTIDAQKKGFAVTADDVRRRFGDEPLTPEAVLQALATAVSASSMEVDANTPDAELDAFLFGPWGIDLLTRRRDSPSYAL